MCVPCKEEEDQQMAVAAATLYARVIRDVGDVRAIDYSAPLFYADVMSIQSRVAKLMINGKLLNKAQTKRLIDFTLQVCYDSDEIKAWARADPDEIHEKAAQWTEKFFAWAAVAQKFYTDLINEIGDWDKHAAAPKEQE